MKKRPIQAYLVKPQHDWLDIRKSNSGLSKSDIIAELINKEIKKEARKNG